MQCLPSSSPDPRGHHGVPESHSSRLEDVGYLWVDSRVVAHQLEGVTRCVGVRETTEVALVLSAEESGQPFGIHDVLVSSDGEDTSTVEQPFIVAPFIVTA